MKTSECHQFLPHFQYLLNSFHHACERIWKQYIPLEYTKDDEDDNDNKISEDDKEKVVTSNKDYDDKISEDKNENISECGDNIAPKLGGILFHTLGKQNETDENQAIAASENSEDYIKIKVVGQDSNEINFKVKQTTQMVKLKISYSQEVGVSMNTLCFIFKGQILENEDTPATLKMEQDDSIEVYQNENQCEPPVKKRLLKFKIDGVDVLKEY